MTRDPNKPPLSILAKRVALFFSFAWFVYGFVMAYNQHHSLERALVVALMPGGLLLAAAFIAYASPRGGAIMLMAGGVLIWTYAKQETPLTTVIVTIPPLATGFFLLLADMLDRRGH